MLLLKCSKPSWSSVNTASLGGVVGIPTLGVYSATKHAVVGLTKAIAGEYGRKYQN